MKCPKCTAEVNGYRKTFRLPNGQVKRTWLCDQCKLIFVTLVGEVNEQTHKCNSI